ncbi:alpha/beta hydrolase [bacterium]|jgi:pimeloyl-ACP methyl ester carboxylesterase|nr:alpha/beta hydrolase [bacterium]
MNAFQAQYVAPISGSKKPTLLFIAGLWSQADTWTAWQNLASQQGYESWALTLQPKNGDTTLKDYKEYVVKFLEYLKQELGVNPIIIGHSMAGLVTQMIAAYQKVPAVVLLNSAAPAGINNLSLQMFLRTWKHLRKIFGDRLFIPSLADTKALMFNNLTHLNAAETLTYYQELLPDAGRATREILLGTVAVKSTFCPTLVIGGRHDKLLPARIQRKLAVKYSAPYHEIDHGHVTMLEPGSELVLYHILQWIEEIRQEL